MFDMEGNMCSGIGDYLVYPDSRHLKAVPTLSIADACSEFGTFPAYVKMDIEGAELASIGEQPGEGGRILEVTSDSFRDGNELSLVDNEYTYKSLDRLFPTLGYEVSSSKKSGQMFTWARPTASHA